MLFFFLFLTWLDKSSPAIQSVDKQAEKIEAPMDETLNWRL